MYQFLSLKKFVTAALLVVSAVFTLSCNNQAVYTVQKRQIKTSDSLINVDINYIELSSTSPKVNKWMDSINKAIRHKFTDQQDSILKYSRAEREYFKEPRPPYQLMVLDTVYLSNKNIISILYTIYSFTGGAHGMTGFIGYNYDIQNMKELSVDHLFKKGTEPQINQLLCEYMQNPYNCFTTSPTLQEVSSVNIGNESITFIYSQYTLGPYVCGPAVITIPSERLKEYLTPELNLGK